MDEEQERILKMVEAGQISAGEANELLEALGTGAEEAPAPAQQVETPLDRPWEVPFFGGLVVALLGSMGLIGRGRSGLLRIGAWTTFLLGVLLTAVGFWSRDVPWLHLRVVEQDGDRISLSFPLPFFLADWSLRLAGTYLDEDTAARLASAAEFVEAWQRDPDGDPFTIQVDEGDGDQVLIYIG